MATKPNDDSSLSHTRWNYKYHIVFISNESKKIKDSIINHKDEFITYAKEYEKKNTTANEVDYTEINKLKDRQKQIDTFIEKLINGNIEGKIPDSTYNTMLQKYKKEYDEIKHKISQLIDVKSSVSANSYLDLFIYWCSWKAWCK